MVDSTTLDTEVDGIPAVTGGFDPDDALETADLERVTPLPQDDPFEGAGDFIICPTIGYRLIERVLDALEATGTDYFPWPWRGLTAEQVLLEVNQS
jgi:hypothetical protein